MIAENTLRVASKADDSTLLYLAPFGVKELAQYVPTNPDIMPFESNAVRYMYTGTPLSVFEAEERASYIRSWGLYEGTPTTEAFIGTIDLADKGIGNPVNPTYTKVIREVGTLILKPDKRGKGIGSLAKLAVMQYAYEQEAALAFVAETSEYNAVSQGSLTKVGFTHIDTRHLYEFPGGEQTQHWMLASPKVQASLARQAGSSESQRHALENGWNRFAAAMHTLKVEE